MTNTLLLQKPLCCYYYYCWLVLLMAATTTPWIGVVTVTTAAPADDRIKSLPLFGAPPTPHYSGYLDATAGCDTDINGDSCKIHYWFCTADGATPQEAARKPVVLWLEKGKAKVIVKREKVDDLLRRDLGL